MYNNSKPSHYVDGSNATLSNWMRYINYACNEDQQNMIAYQLQSEIYYKTIRTVTSGEELLVWYKDECGIVLSPHVSKCNSIFAFIAHYFHISCYCLRIIYYS